MSTIERSESKYSVPMSEVSSANLNKSNNDFNISDIEMLFQQVMQKMRETGNKLATSQSINGFKMQKSAVEQKRHAAGETKTAGLINAGFAMGGGVLGLSGAIGGSLFSKRPNGLLNDEKVTSLNAKLSKLTAENKKLNGVTSKDIGAQLDEKWSDYCRSLNEEQKIKFKPGLLRLDEASPNRLKLNSDIDRLRNDCAEKFDVFCEEIGGGQLTSGQRKAANKWLEGKMNKFKELDEAIKNFHPDTWQSQKREIGMAVSQAAPGVANAVGGAVASGFTLNASSEQIKAEFIKDNHSVYDRQRGLDADNLRTNLQKLMDNMRSLVDLHGAMLNAGTMK